MPCLTIKTDLFVSGVIRNFFEAITILDSQNDETSQLSFVVKNVKRHTTVEIWFLCLVLIVENILKLGQEMFIRNIISVLQNVVINIMMRMMT